MITFRFSPKSNFQANELLKIEKLKESGGMERIMEKPESPNGRFLRLEEA